MTERRFGISGFTLKCIAMAAMLIDHVGAVLYPQYIELRMIGRLAFPIYCFLLVEGAMHTHDIRSYEKRLLLFAIISEIPCDLAFYGKVWEPSHQNVFLTLLIGLVTIDLFEQCREKGKKLNEVLILIAAIVIAQVLQVDYKAGGVLIIICFYELYPYMWKHGVFAAFNLCYYGISTVQAYASLAAFPMLLYNGKRGPGMKYFFYIFYPAHLLILYFIKYKL